MNACALENSVYLMFLHMRLDCRRIGCVVATMMTHMHSNISYLHHGRYATRLGLCWRGYVHRLIQNQSDRKPVELPSSLSLIDHTDLTSGGYVPREKQDKIGMEYIYLLKSQLDSYSTYFEEKVAQAADTTASMLKDTLKRICSDSRPSMIP